MYAKQSAAIHIRRCIFRPYRKGLGPSFRLDLYDTGEMFDSSHYRLGYRLTECEPPMSPTVLFEGEDYGCPTHQAIDSDATVEGIMGFLTLRPGDTDSDYFANYTEAQRTYCDQHAEALSCEVSNRYCDPETGAVIEGKRR